jgi:hypothetical protein
MSLLPRKRVYTRILLIRLSASDHFITSTIIAHAPPARNAPFLILRTGPLSALRVAHAIR